MKIKPCTVAPIQGEDVILDPGELQFPRNLDKKINGLAIPAMEAAKSLSVAPTPLDHKIDSISAPKSTIPAVEAASDPSDEVDVPSIPIETPVEEEISPPRDWTDRVNEELLHMDEMMQDPNCDHALILQQAYRILNMLMRRAAKTEKEYALDKEPLMWEDVKKLKGTYDSWTVLAASIVSGVLTAAGGILGLGSAIPGSTAGHGLAKLTKLFSFFDKAANGKVLSDLGTHIGTFGKASDVFGGIFRNTEEAKRTVYQHLIEEARRKVGDRQDAYRQDRDQGTGAINNSRSVAEALHRAFEMFTRNQG